MSQRSSRHPFVCAVCHSKPRVLWMEIRRSRMSTFLTSYAHAFCTVTWRDLVLHVQKKQKAKKSSLSWVISVSKICNSIGEFTIPLEYVSLWEGFSEHCGCHLFVVRVPERSAVCSQALCAVSGEASANFERPSRSHFSFDSRQQAIVV